MAAIIELTCDTSPASAVENFTKYRAEASALCDKGDSKECDRVALFDGHIAKCSSPSSTFGSRYVFSMDDSVLSGNQLAFAEFFTQGCAGGKSGLSRASVTTTPSLITFKIKHPEVQQPINFVVDRESLQVRTASSLYECTVRKINKQNKL